MLAIVRIRASEWWGFNKETPDLPQVLRRTGVIRSMTLRLVLAMMLALVAASPASAATVLLSDDAEGAIEDKWVAAPPTNPLMEPWQKSNSAAPKVRGNQRHEGATSYWAGMKPQGFHPVDVIEGEITLTSKAPILIPADGKTTVSFWSLFQNEGDDAGTFEAALASNPTAKGAWKKIAAVKLETSDVANPEYVPGYCVARPQAFVQGFEELKGDFSAFAGQLVLVRFNMKYGSENRATSMPCGWYVDDIKIETTGTPGNAGAGAPDAAPADPAAAPPGRRVAPALQFSIKPGRDTRPPFAFRTVGKLVPPEGVQPADACQGRVSVQVKRGKKTVSNRRTQVREDCTFADKVAFRDRKRLGNARSLRVIVTFQGNKFLLPQKAKPGTFRVR